jgi:hypothetical protein
MNIRDDSTLEHVVIDFAKRTVEMHGSDGEYKDVSCNFDAEGLQEFQNMVEFCQQVLSTEQIKFKL